MLLRSSQQDSEEPKSPTKKTPAQLQIETIKQLITEFDIETQVRKITVSTMDSYMRRYCRS